MSESLITKRLHISGLTPSITPAELEHRLSSFGKVTAIDGFGARDALGDPRKFGFVTMEIGTKELAKCLSVLNGSTWKGTKLRIGEAKPDFRERLAKMNAQTPRPIRPKRTHARNLGYPSSTLPLTPLSASAAASTPGWIITPSGRVVRPVRMRPERPLCPMHHELSASKTQDINRKVKKRIKPPPVRARRRLIDPTKWDSVYLKGVFLDAVPVPFPETPSLEKHDDGEDGEDTDADSETVSTSPQLIPHDRTHTFSSSAVATVSTSSGIHGAAQSIDVHDEANAALVMLSKMFGDEKDWDGKESVDPMEDFEDDEARDNEMQVDVEDDVEILCRDLGEGKRSNQVKMDKGKGKGKEKSVADVVRSNPRDEVDARDVNVAMEENGPRVNTKVSARTAEPAPLTNLKALFAPMEDASFSIVNHLDLDLDLELEADILGIGALSGASQENGYPSQQILSAPQVAEIPTTKSTAKARSRITLDPSLPLLFPTPDSLPHPYGPSSNSTTHRHSTGSCFLFPSTSRVGGLYHLPSSTTFTRSPQDTPESIRESWEKGKVALTREWKKAWREARGTRRGRVAAGADIGGGY